MGPGTRRRDGSPLPVRPPLPRLHAITDERVARLPDLAARAASLARGAGADVALHARGRALSGLEHFTLATDLSRAAPSPLFVNDRLDIALATGAIGVQLSRASLDPADARRMNPRWWIGQSAHDLAEAEAARAAGADYLVVGPMFPTPTHPGRAPLSSATLTAIVALDLPVIGVGGVGPGCVTPLRAQGLYGVAAIRALWDADDPADAARRMLQELEA